MTTLRGSCRTEPIPAAKLPKPRPAPVIEKKVLRMRELTETLGLSRAWINALVRRGDFPAPIRLGVKARGYLVRDVEQWLAEREAMRDLAS